MSGGSVAGFMAQAPAALQGNTPWASAYAQTIRRVVTSAAFYSPRSLQTELGPSELGVHCDRQIVSKLAGLPRTNHVVDPWPSIVGTAVHAWLAKAIMDDNRRTGQLRFIAEQRVHPHPDHPGTADAYDAFERALIDWKVLGQTPMAKLRQLNKPARRYIIQLLLYAMGYRALGLPVDRIVLVAFPRTGSSLAGMYVWEHKPSADDDLLIGETFRRVAIHKQLASEIQQGRMTIDQIPRQPDDEDCFFCPFYRPQSARDGGPGCPGTVQQQYD